MQAYGWDSNYVNEQANAIMKGVAGSVKPSGPYLSLYTYNKINSWHIAVELHNPS